MIALTLKAMWNREFQYFSNQHSTVYSAKKFRQALRTHEYYIQEFFWVILLALS